MGGGGAGGVRRAVAALLAASLSACTTGQQYDLIVRNGTVYDGTGAAPRQADIGIAGDRIRAMGTLDPASGRSVIDASGKAVAPGFIDPLVRRDTPFVHGGAALHYVAQGVTTVVLVVSDGNAPGGRGVYVEGLLRSGISPNLATLAVATSPDRLEDELVAGAAGLWLGLAAPVPAAAPLAPFGPALAVVRDAGAALVIVPPVDVPARPAVQQAIDMAVASRVPALAIAAGVGGQPADQVADLANITRRAINAGTYASLILEPSALPRGDGGTREHLRSLLGWGEMMPTAGDDPDAYGTWLRTTAGAGLLPLEEAIRRATSQPARRLGLGPRGELRENASADLVIFDPEALQPGTGRPVLIDHVLVNGVPVIAGGNYTGARPGRIVNGPRFPRAGGN